MAWIVDAVSTRGYKKEVVEAVRSIAKTLLHHRFNTMVQPSLHYAFLHGDLHRFNVLSSTHGPVFIDWARCTIGPKQIDLATLLRRHGFRGTTELLQEIGEWQQLDPVNKVLFALALVVVSLMIDIPAIKNEPSEHLFIPAAKCIEELLGAINDRS
ncbi:MAG: aminoglycoside phosphotransferase family protein [Flavobacteriales bacterium]|nr:aminoglycoside phosphotransferase family protein [Flavobacteriales bacterium]